MQLVLRCVNERTKKFNHTKNKLSYSPTLLCTLLQKPIYTFTETGMHFYKSMTNILFFSLHLLFVMFNCNMWISVFILLQVIIVNSNCSLSGRSLQLRYYQEDAIVKRSYFTTHFIIEKDFTLRISHYPAVPPTLSLFHHLTFDTNHKSAIRLGRFVIANVTHTSKVAMHYSNPKTIKKVTLAIGIVRCRGSNTEIHRRLRNRISCD